MYDKDNDKQNINKLETSKIYIILLEQDTERPIGFYKWKRLLNFENIENKAQNIQNIEIK